MGSIIAKILADLFKDATSKEHLKEIVDNKSQSDRHFPLQHQTLQDWTDPIWERGNNNDSQIGQ